MAAQSALIDPAQYLEGELRSKIRHEFVAGSVYAMSGASINHVEITSQLTWVLRRDLNGTPCRNFDQDIKVWIEATSSYFYPDATISCPPNVIDKRNGVIDNPTVVFEVLSPSSASLDRGHKFTAYRTLGSLRHYVIVDSESPNIEVFSLENGEWVVRFYTGMDATAEIPTVELKLALAELYQHVTFTPQEGP